MVESKKQKNMRPNEFQDIRVIYLVPCSRARRKSSNSYPKHVYVVLPKVERVTEKGSYIASTEYYQM